MTGSAFKRWTLYCWTESKGRGGLGERGCRRRAGFRAGGFILEVFFRSWPVLGGLGAALGRSCAVLRGLGVVLERSGSVLGDFGAVLEPSWGHLGSFYEASWCQKH